MKYLKIQNDGELDIRLVALMGGTTKAHDKYKIGQFGTGLKYTLAFLIRNNLDFKIMVGENEVKIHTEKETIRDEVFEIICITGQRTSITTRMGEDWEAWMIIRELWCNALDEGNALRDTTDTILGEAGKTIFYIQVDRQVETVLSNWNKYFIHEQEPVFKNNHCALYPAGEHMTLYKQGVLIYENKNEKSVFSYDLGNADINELREYRGSMAHAIVQCLCGASEEAARYFLENVKETNFEGKEMDYEWWSSWGPAWKNVIGSAKIIYPKVLNDIKARGGHPDETGLIIVPECVYRALTKQFEGIGALRVASKINDFYEQYSEDTESKVKQALTILEHCNYPMHDELEFVFGFFEDKTTQAKISFDEKKIYVSNGMVQQPLFSIVAMLVEENEHFNTGMSDETRQFQQHFINLYTRQLLAGCEIEI